MLIIIILAQHQFEVDLKATTPLTLVCNMGYEAYVSARGYLFASLFWSQNGPQIKFNSKHCLTAFRKTVATFLNTHLIVGLKRLLCENIYLATPEMKFKKLAPCVTN